MAYTLCVSFLYGIQFIAYTVQGMPRLFAAGFLPVKIFDGSPVSYLIETANLVWLPKNLNPPEKKSRRLPKMKT